MNKNTFGLSKQDQGCQHRNPHEINDKIIFSMRTDYELTEINLKNDIG